MAGKRSKLDYQKLLTHALNVCHANNDTPIEWRLTTDALMDSGMSEFENYEVRVLGLPVYIVEEHSALYLMGQLEYYHVTDNVLKDDTTKEPPELYVVVEDGDEDE